MRTNYVVNSGVRFQLLSQDQLQELFDGVLHVLEYTGLDVYHDEAQEYFFSAENDNDCKFQFVVNAGGVVFDYVREYDLAAVGTRSKIERSVEHRKAMRYDGGTWTTEIVFPLREIKIDLAKRRYAGFQAAFEVSLAKAPDE